MFSSINVSFTPPECAYEVLRYISTQNKTVTLLVDKNGDIIISADMLDYNNRTAEFED